MSKQEEFRFSALQRAENSSIQNADKQCHPLRVFQCSSASRKFLNRQRLDCGFDELRFQCSSASRKFLNRTEPNVEKITIWRFSALQRAENSSIAQPLHVVHCDTLGFSALQRAENSSMASRGRTREYCAAEVSVLFSEPKIPQCWGDARTSRATRQFQCSSASRKFLNSILTVRWSGGSATVSVLFSEPKIPQ